MYDFPSITPTHSRDKKIAYKNILRKLSARLWDTAFCEAASRLRHFYNPDWVSDKPKKKKNYNNTKSNYRNTLAEISSRFGSILTTNSIAGEFNHFK
jgi:hypothetical protein